MKHRILLVDDHQIVRDGLRLLLDREADLEVVGEASDGREAQERVEDLQPDIVVMDVSMPGLNGIEATRMLKARYPELKIIALSVHNNERYVENMLRAGASGYLVKSCAAEELVRAVRAVLRQQTYLSANLTAALVDKFIRRSDAAIELNSHALSVREREILQLLAEGMTAKDISTRLNLSVKTVESHRQHIMDKLNLHSTVELVRYAIREGISPIE